MHAGLRGITRDQMVALSHEGGGLYDAPRTRGSRFYAVALAKRNSPDWLDHGAAVAPIRLADEGGAAAIGAGADKDAP
jgi:hypothetical protein